MRLTIRRAVDNLSVPFDRHNFNRQESTQKTNLKRCLGPTLSTWRGMLRVEPGQRFGLFHVWLVNDGRRLDPGLSENA